MIMNANALHLPIADKSVQCVVTSPPYYGLRDYGISGQLGLESTPGEYVNNLILVFREVWRVLKDDGVLFLNLGDSYSTSGSGRGDIGRKITDKVTTTKAMGKRIYRSAISIGLKSKDLIGIPWMVAFALRADGWYLRQDIIWSKPNPMPESVTDRCTKSHEYIFLLTKSARYYCDMEAIKEPGVWSVETRKANANENQKSFPDSKRNGIRQRKPAGWDTRQGAHGAFHREGRAEDIEYTTTTALTRNKRSVWSIATQPMPMAHFATYPEKLVEPCILAGSRPGDLVLDPFAGSGTTLRVAIRHGRKAIGCELNFKYISEIAPIRMVVQPLLQEINNA